MTRRPVARRNQQRAAVFHALDFAVEKAELGRIALVVSGVDRERKARQSLMSSIGIPRGESAEGRRRRPILQDAGPKPYTGMRPMPAIGERPFTQSDATSLTEEDFTCPG